MRSNSPLPSDDFRLLNVVEDTSAISRLTKEDLELAKISNSPDWKVILSYLNSRIESCREELFSSSLEGGALDKIGAGFIASRSVINELQAVISKVELTAKAVSEAGEQDAEKV